MRQTYNLELHDIQVGDVKVGSVTVNLKISMATKAVISAQKVLKSILETIKEM